MTTDDRHPRAGRTGLILAAGLGSRTERRVDDIPKPLLEVGGRALILRTLDSLERAGCSRVVVVLGHKGHVIRAFLDANYTGSLALDFAENPRFQLQNGVSLLSARNWLPESFVLAMADHVFENSVMELAASYSLQPGHSCVAVDSKLSSILDMADATKVEVRAGQVIRIGKSLTHFNAVDCGLFIAGSGLLDVLDGVLQATGDASLSQGVQALADRGKMDALDIGAGFWQDVDNAEMLAAADELVRAGPTVSVNRGT